MGARTAEEYTMRITVRNIDGSELARWNTWQISTLYDMPDISRPSFNLLPNHDERCAYVIEFATGEQTDDVVLMTGIPLNLAVDLAIAEYTAAHPDSLYAG
jgi:hypothetical protein